MLLTDLGDTEPYLASACLCADPFREAGMSAMGGGGEGSCASTHPSLGSDWGCDIPWPDRQQLREPCKVPVGTQRSWHVDDVVCYRTRGRRGWAGQGSGVSLLDDGERGGLLGVGVLELVSCCCVLIHIMSEETRGA